MEQFFSTKEVCVMFKISRSTLSRWLADGNFPPPRKIYSHSGNRWTGTDLNKMMQSMPIGDAYKNSGYQEGQRA
ncbi:helix-turn-helix domain-containing protein [candidate division KSB1 bacterium]|nr:helix-turn-helix domain-containing protein [candidate division KSB1 bacterium]